MRDDAQARDLRSASRLYADGRLDDARRDLRAYGSTEARIGAAFAAWPDTMPALEALPPARQLRRPPPRGLVLGTARRRARGAHRLEAARVEPDTPYAVRADDFLHPTFAPGLPLFVPSSRSPAALAGAHRAISSRSSRPTGRRAARLHYGSALQRIGRPARRRRVFDEAVRARTHDPETLTAAAVSRFDKDEPAAAFSRLGPLTRRFPRAQTVRFHLGLLLVWSGDAEGAKRQLRLARAAEPGKPAGAGSKALSRPSLGRGTMIKKDEPNGLWRPSATSGTLPRPPRTLTLSDAAVR